MKILSYLIIPLTAVQTAFHAKGGYTSTFILHAMVHGEERPIYLRYNTMNYTKNTIGFYNILEAQGDVTDLSDYPYNCTLPNVSRQPILWQYDMSTGKLRVDNAAGLKHSWDSVLGNPDRDFCLTLTSDSKFYSIDDCLASPRALEHIRRTIEDPEWVEYSRQDKKGKKIISSCMGFKSYYNMENPWYFDRILAKCSKKGQDINSHYFKEISV